MVDGQWTCHVAVSPETARPEGDVDQGDERRDLDQRAHDAREPVEGPLDGIASLTFAEAEGVLETDAAAAMYAEQTTASRDG